MCRGRGCAPSSALLPWVGLPGPHPGFLSFHDERNQRRARGCRPWTLLGGIIIPPATLLLPQKVAAPRAAKIPPRMPQSLYPRNQYRQGRDWGNPRGSSPLCWGQTKRSLVSPWQHLCGYFQSHPGRSALLLGERRGAPLAHPSTPVGKKEGGKRNDYFFAGRPADSYRTK